MATLIDLIGVVDNLGEEQPVLNRRAAILGITISFQILTVMCVLFRLYARFFIMRSPWWDDLFVALSLVSKQLGLIPSPSPIFFNLTVTFVTFQADLVLRFP